MAKQNTLADLTPRKAAPDTLRLDGGLPVIIRPPPAARRSRG